jgi:hypothetical protein
VVIFNYGPPFRGYIWQNPLFLLSVLFAFAFAWVFIFKADPKRETWIWNGFYLLDFRTGEPEDPDCTASLKTNCSKTYYSYRWMLFIVVWVQIISNVIFEFFFIRWFTRRTNDNIEAKKQEKFENVMEVLSKEKGK